MSIEGLGALGEIVGALAVLASHCLSGETDKTQ
jgi:hypothetical protein